MNTQIEYSRPLVSVQDLVNFIKKGEQYKLEILDSTDNSVNKLDFLYGIVLSPDYQRDYRSNSSEESSIIESLILGIPIPEVFLVKTSDEIQLRHVMDGQHRLTAIYRYINNEFALRNLEILDHENGKLIDDPLYEKKRFKDLDNSTKIKILGSNISILQFESFNNPELEIELFKRYNKNSKPLEPQEIAMATYFSKTSQFLSHFISRCFSSGIEGEFNSLELGYSDNDYIDLRNIYNITRIKKEKQKNHRELCIVLNVLENGLGLYEEKLADGVKIATNYLQKKSKKYKNDEDENLDNTIKLFKEFNKFVIKLSNYVDMPISVQILNDENVNSRYHVGVSIILAMIHYIFDINLSSEHLFDEVSQIISLSPVGDSKYRASTTNIRTLIKYLFEDNKIHEKQYNSLILKDGLDVQISSLLKK